MCVCAQFEEATDGDGADRRAVSEPDSQTRRHQDGILGARKFFFWRNSTKKLAILIHRPATTLFFVVPSLPSSPSFLPFLSPFLLCLPFPSLLAVLLHTHLTSHGDSTSDKRKAKGRRLEMVTATKSTLEDNRSKISLPVGPLLRDEAEAEKLIEGWFSSSSGLKFLVSYFSVTLFNPCSLRTLNCRIGCKWLQDGWLKKIVTKEKNMRKKKKYTTKGRKCSHVQFYFCLHLLLAIVVAFLKTGWFT